jgi:GT2 family glycosyltransferase
MSSRISTIVVNWNQQTLLSRCLESLRRQTVPPDEVIVVDNGSSDGSRDMLQVSFPEARLLPLVSNEGFARACNLGIRAAHGEYVALLNNDAEAQPGWLEALQTAIDSQPEIGFCASKMLLADNSRYVDGCGDFYTREGTPGKIGHMDPAEVYSTPALVFGACAGAAIYRREMLADIGLFDEDFFITHEDSDLSFRAQLKGYKCQYVPSAVVLHRLGATLGRESNSAVYFAQRNMEFVYLKNMPASLIARYWALHLAVDLGLLLSYSSRGHLRTYWRAKRHAALALRTTLAKRRTIQAERRVPDDYIDSILTKGRLKARLLGKPPARVLSKRPGSASPESNSDPVQPPG